jgi:FixJ family two-component response regulator
MSQVKPFVAVVDDDDSLCRAIKRLLRSTGLASDTFKTGDDFLDMFDSIPSYRPACIVLDVQMPGSNGIEIQRRLVGSGIPVVFITAHGRDRRSRTDARCRRGSVLAQAV